ncbi:Apolipoprotein N-acyltransferase [Nymphon striatum]|nr:Apolipoprotein N-acyltransferase [Nymphon striatum]
MTLKSMQSDLIVWPETGLFDTFDRHMGSLIEPLQKSLSKTKKTILMGGFYVNENQGVENSVLAISAENREIYSKRHLVPFGEYTPLLKYIRWLSKWIQLPYDNISSGVNDGTLMVGDQIAQMSICYEDAFGSEIIQSLPLASMLINVTHDGWFTGSLEPQQHMQIARMRALETGRYMVRATTTGPSGIINEKGQLVETAPLNTKSIITGKVQPFSGATPYVRWGNWLIIGILGVILLLGVIWKREG